MARPKVLIAGAGFAGFRCARERLLRPSEAELTLASPVDYMLSAGDARQTAEWILAHDPEGWLA